jgi:hypothetical protein
MHSSPCSTQSGPPADASADQKTAHPGAGRWDYRIYQGLTIAAMLVSLATLWLFW